MIHLQYAVRTKIRDGRRNPRRNFLDYSIDKYGVELVNDTRVLLRLLVLYLPLPLFWALYIQQGSRWTFQADKMNGDIGFYIIKPDQFGLISPLLVIVLIPIFESIVYPILSKIGIRRPLQKLAIGGALAAISFLISAFIQLKIEAAPEKSVHMLWLTPQYVVIVLSEVMFAVTGIAFSYEQAPDRMKSVVMGFWQLNVSFGNLIVLFVAQLAVFESQAYEFLFYFGMTLIDILIFIILAYNYKSVKQTEVDDEQIHKPEYLIPLQTLEKTSSEK